MKRIFSLFAALLLVLQMILPQVVMAQATNDKKEGNGVTLTDVVVKEGTSDYTIAGEAKNDTEDAIPARITVSDNVALSVALDGIVLDADRQEIGKYELDGNVITFSIPAKMSTVFNFQIKGVYDGKAGKATFSDGVHVISKDVGKADVVPKQEPVVTPDVVKTPVLKDGPRDLKDLFASLGYEDKEQTILTDMRVTYTNKDGEVVTEPTVDDKIHFAFDWSIPDDVGALVNAGDYYTFKLPDNVMVNQNMTIDLGEYAKAVVNKDGTVTITFTDAVKGSSDVHGTLHFEAGFDEHAIDGPGDTTIKVPGEENLPSTEVIIKPEVGATIDKNGHFDKAKNPDRVIWNVDINKGLDTIENARVTEAFPDGLTFDSVKVYTVDVDLRGNVIPGSEKLVTTGYTLDADGNVTFTNPIDGAYRLVYDTSIQDDKKPLDGGTIKFENRATLSGDGVDDVTASATVDASYGKVLAKSSTNYDPDKQVFEWTIKYNYGEKHIDKDDAVLMDTFGSDKMVLLTNSVRLYNVTFDQNGKEVQGAPLVAGTDYELLETERGFEIRFLHDVDGAVKIKYKTGIDGIITDDIDVSNSVDVSTGQHGGSTGTMYQQNLVKKLGAVDYDNKTVSWDIDVNKNHYVMKNWKMTDTLSDGLTLIPDSMVVYDVDAKRELVAGMDYALVYDGVANVFTIEFLNGYKTETNHAFKISYSTTFDMRNVNSKDSDKRFKNNASSTWQDENGNPHSSKDDATFDPNQPAKYNGFKNGSYNARTRLITWEIGINYDGADLDNAQIVDPILGNQKFVKGSVKIYTYTVNPDGSVKKGKEISDYSDFVINEPSKRNKNTLTVNFPHGKSAMYLVTFDTSVEGELVSTNYKNDAVFKNNNYPDHTLSADVSVTHGGKLAMKSGKQDEDGFVNWEIMVNPSLSQLDDVVVTDRPSTNQSIDLDSVAIYHTVVNEDGSLETNQRMPLLEGLDYTLELTTDNATGQQVVDASGETVQDRLVTDDTGRIEATNLAPGDYQFIEIEAPSGYILDTTPIGFTVENSAQGKPEKVEAGEMVNYQGSAVLHKQDAAGNALEGAVFKLVDGAGNALQEVTSDKDGTVSVGNLEPGAYQLLEIEAPRGYLLNGQAIKFTIEASSVGKPQELDLGVFVNYQGSVTLTKTDTDKRPLADAQFDLMNQDEELVLSGLTSNRDGKIEVPHLAPGDYYFVETKAPTGYELDNKQIPFTISNTANGKPETIEISFENHKTPAEITPPDKKKPTIEEKITGKKTELPSEKVVPDRITATSKLPATGDTGAESGWLVVIGLTMIAGVVRFGRR
ncbi:LPXTG cell wall anchor domain-containing protein [Paenilisteria newyorkensis]|uniref:LPXTG cell wall anchor domain-containing protein n=1 Tax=Listeria newyorkensis TaxID=1497681 RepID=UPI0023582CC3|nr:LPXTG cell wall anchor domain-containing protein [Listeria newyorkensis]WAO22403.1 collagen binding domain-containing protein [Listeria newyorkensis]